MKGGIRIISGAFRGKRLHLPDEKYTRPTSQRVREAIFSTLYSQTKEKRPNFILDAFAGSGALGFEALSQGAKKSIFFEKSSTVFNILKENASHIGILKDVILVPKNFFSQKTWPFEKVDLVFLDPPYGKGLIQKAIEHLHNLEAIHPEAWIVCEQGRLEKNLWPDFCKEVTHKNYGDTAVIFLQYMPNN